MKRVSIILLMFVLMMLSCSCDIKTHEIQHADEKQSEVSLSRNQQWVQVGFYGKGNTAQILYADKDTGVMYMLIDGNHEMGLTVMYNSDGTLMKYNFEKNEIIKK